MNGPTETKAPQNDTEVLQDDEEIQRLRASVTQQAAEIESMKKSCGATRGIPEKKVDFDATKGIPDRTVELTSRDFSAAPASVAESAAIAAANDYANKWFKVAMLFAATTLLMIVAEIVTIAVAFSYSNSEGDSNGGGSSAPAELVVVPQTTFATVQPPSGRNVCEGTNPKVPNVQCTIDDILQVGEQSGVNVTKGYNGKLNTEAVPISVPYFQMGMCPVNVHWHLGAEHYSVGQFDENGSGPSDVNKQRKLAGETRQGFQCNLYNEKDPKFTTPYNWQHCIGMEVGQTYEVHWPHSAAGACGTLNQYQTPFYDGVFCNASVLTDTAAQIGVQGQVFTIVNDDRYYYPDLMRGMIVEGDKGTDLAMYTGSTTGTSRNNEVCSQYAPITWQVDRKCHIVSASTFDKMCADMKAQRDDMSDDLYAHGSRELVSDHLAADNHANRLRRA